MLVIDAVVFSFERNLRAKVKTVDASNLTLPARAPKDHGGRNSNHGNVRKGACNNGFAARSRMTTQGGCGGQARFNAFRHDLRLAQVVPDS